MKNLMVLLFTVFVFTACKETKHEEAVSAETAAIEDIPVDSVQSTDNTTAASAIIYTCSMHPEVQSDKPGKCPNCGMELIVKK
jgi:PBP1b-binding outer membrane lipoprotein LpoB